MTPTPDTELMAVTQADRDFLLDLADRIFCHATPANGFDQGDVDELHRIASTRPADDALADELDELAGLLFADTVTTHIFPDAMKRAAKALRNRQPAPRADDALRMALERTAASLDSMSRNIGAVSLTRNPLGIAIRAESEAALAAARAALASEEPTGPVCTLCGLTLKGD